RGEYKLALIVLLLSVKFDGDNVSRNIVDEDTKWVSDSGSWISADDTDLSTSNSEAPEAASEALNKSTKSRFNFLWNEWENLREVDKDMVHIRVVVTNDLHGVQNVIDKSIRLGNEVFGSWYLVSETAWTDDGSGKVTLVRGNLFANSFVDMDVPVLSEDRFDVEVGEPVELKLEGQGWLNVTNRLIFLKGRVTESEISRV